MLEKFFYATIITLLLPILLGISPFSKPQSPNFKEITWKNNYIQDISPEPRYSATSWFFLVNTWHL